MKKLVIAAAMLAATASPAWAGGNSSTTNGTATALVVAPIVLTHASGASLNFGKFTVGTGGTVVVNALGAGSTTGGVAFVPGSTTAADSFSVTGDPQRNFGISTTGGTAGAGATTMAFSTTPSATSGIINSSGNFSITVGGVLTSAGTEGPGSYSGTYTVTVTYQ